MQQLQEFGLEFPDGGDTSFAISTGCDLPGIERWPARVSVHDFISRSLPAGVMIIDASPFLQDQACCHAGQSMKLVLFWHARVFAESPRPFAFCPINIGNLRMH